MPEDIAADGLTFAVRWLKPLVPTGGGEATLLLRVVPGPRPAGARRAPIDVAFALDRSGSMSGDKLRLVKDAVDVAVGLLREEDRVALTVYDNLVQTLHPLAAATPKTKTALRLALHGVDAGGSTALADGWLTACRELAEPPAAAHAPAANGRTGQGEGVRVRRALLLTDGLANVGLTEPAALTEHAGQLRRRGVGTTTLGVGLDVDDDLLAGLAEAGGGNYQWIERPEDPSPVGTSLRAFFAREIGELLAIVAGDLRLTLTLPHGVRGTLVGPYPAERQGKRITVALGDLPAGEEIPLLLSLRVAPGALGAVHRLAAEATWVDPAADARRGRALDVPPLAYAGAATVEATAGDPQVREQVALQTTAAAHREAVRLDRAGRYVESRRVLHEATATLMAAPATDAIVDYRTRHARVAGAAADLPLAEEERKRVTWGAHRVARGRRTDE